MNFESQGGGLPGAGSSGLPGRETTGGGLPPTGAMPGGLPSPQDSRNDRTRRLAGMIPHIMNLLGDGSPAVTQQINGIQEQADIQRQKDALSKFGHAVFSNPSGRVDPKAIEAAAQRFGIDPMTAMAYIDKFMDFRKKQRGAQQTFSRREEDGGIRTIQAYPDQMSGLPEGFFPGELSGSPRKELGFGQSKLGIFSKETGDIVHEAPEKESGPLSTIGKLMTDRDGLPPGDPRRAAYDQAISKATSQRGMLIESDGKDGFRVMTNADQAAGAQGLTKPVKTQVQKGLLDATDNLSRISEIENLFNPGFQLIGTKINASYLKTLDKLGQDLDPTQQKLLDDYTEYKSAAGQMVADTLKKLSGAAVTEHEAKRAYEYIPKPGTGWFDGDSPRQIQAKIGRFKAFTRRAAARLNFINSRGLSIEDIPLDRMDKVIKRRGNEIEVNIKASQPGLSAAELKDATLQKLSEEFGLVF